MNTEWRVVEKSPRGLKRRKFIDGRPTNNFMVEISTDPILDLQVGSSEDDAMQVYSEMVLTETANYMASSRWWGHRYAGVPIPNLSVINLLAAYESVYVINDINDNPDLELFFEDVGDSLPFTTDPDNISLRPRTIADIWTAAGIGMGWRDTPSRIPEVEAVIGRPDWVQGNAMSSIGQNRSNASIAYRTWDYSNHTYAPMLHIEFEYKPDIVHSSFSAEPVSGHSPLLVNFIDESLGPIESWLWDFGDGETSGAQNPTHTFFLPEGEIQHVFTVTLTVTGPSGQDSSQLDILAFGPIEPVIPESTFFWTPEELANFRLYATQPSHAETWQALLDWGDAHLNDIPPAEPNTGDTTEDWIASRDICYSTALHLYNLGILAAVSGDTKYVLAAVPWLLNPISWSTWDPGHEEKGQTRGQWGTAISVGYSFFKDSLNPIERSEVVNRLVYEIGELNYERWLLWPNWPEWPVIWPGQTTRVACAIMCGGLAIVDEYPAAEDWISYATSLIATVLSNPYFVDGNFGGGPSYNYLCEEQLIFSIDILKRLRGINYFDSRLENAAYYILYTYYNGGMLQVEDCTWWMDLDRAFPWEVALIYKIASEYNNGYAQWFADKYSNKYTMFAFIYKNPNVEPIPMSELPLTKHLVSIGYVISREGWGEEDLLLLFKSGVPRAHKETDIAGGHAHDSQNQFQIYRRVPLTCGPGWMPEESETYHHNCIVLANDFGQNNVAGRISALEEDPNYNYMVGDAAQCYEGRLSLCRRSIVMLRNPSYFVIYDEIEAPQPEQVVWQITAPYIPYLTHLAAGYGDSIEGYGSNTGPNTPIRRPAEISINDNVVEIKQKFNDGSLISSLTNIVLEPDNFTSEIVPTWGQFEFTRLKLYPPELATDVRFLNVQFIDNALPTEKVKAGNALGVIIRNGAYLDLTLFSLDGSPVDQYIELGGYYEANDENTYEFEETSIRAQFDVYMVARLIIAGSQQFTVSVSVTGEGTTDPPPGDYAVVEGEDFEIRAIPFDGWKFSHWEGDISADQASVTFTVQDDMSIMAVFTESQSKPIVGLFVGMSVIGAVVAATKVKKN